MKPVNLHQLLEIMQELGCIKLFVIDVSSKRMFFTVRSTPTSNLPERSVDAVFVGDHHKLQKDFLESPKNIQAAEVENEEDEEDAEERDQFAGFGQE
ncbi:hypothetical protein pipiens_003096 [Culex pipiens pipiens]|uniref:Uncharacterized protein n=1 Tax=Culex pipiens pipiens TaxID=38569 RepID=A0ABD1D3S5_CULPP